MFKTITKYFDHLEDKVRGWVSKRPIFFSLLGGFAIVEFWRGVWQLTDHFTVVLGFDAYNFWSNFISLVVGAVILLMTGLYVDLFVSNEVIISGLKQEKKEFEKTTDELKEEDIEIDEINERLARIEILLEGMKKTTVKKKVVRVGNQTDKPIEIIVENEIKNNETNPNSNA